MFNPQFEKIGAVLLHLKMLSEDDLRAALAEQKDSNLRICEMLIKKGLITEDEFIRAYSMQQGTEFINEEDLIKTSAEMVRLLPEDFASENQVVALKTTGEHIYVAMEDPDELSVLDSVKKLTGLRPEVLIAGPRSIKRTIDKLYGQIRQSGEVEHVLSNISIISGEDEDEQELDLSTEQVSADDAPFVKLVNLIITEAIKENSTDIHIEPGRNDVTVRIRIDGVLTKIMSPPISSLNGMVTRIKILSRLNIAEHRLPQDGRMKIRTIDREIDVRVSILPTIFGEKAVLRLLGFGGQTMSLTNLGFPENKLKIFRRWINQPYGMVLISGPTGSGKSTTLYASLLELQDEGTNITTVEDPVEYQINGINQVQMHEEIGLTFAASLRSILRQDPDILLIGEIRDGETADIAVKFSLTGHLVFSTVHANDAPSTVTRLLDIGIPPYLLGSSLNLVMAQRLVRTICPNCKAEDDPDQTLIDRLRMPLDRLDNVVFYKGKGCSHCRYTGYKGRTAIHEVLEVSQPVRQLIFDNANEGILREAAIKQGMTPLREAGFEKIEFGLTSIYEVLRSTVDDS